MGKIKRRRKRLDEKRRISLSQKRVECARSKKIERKKERRKKNREAGGH
jgi:hypothetical protein